MLKRHTCVPRVLKNGKVEPIATFLWHSAPIHSVEWHATDPSVLAASGDDDQVAGAAVCFRPGPS
jgi:hypothetical protein